MLHNKKNAMGDWSPYWFSIQSFTNKINMTKIYRTDESPFPYIFIDELPKEEQPLFQLALFGHTCPYIGDGKRHAAYLHDYEAWKS